MFFRRWCVYRLIDPGSEWRLHRHVVWNRSAWGICWEQDYALVEKNAVSVFGQVAGVQGKLCSSSHRAVAGLFGAKFDVLLYDLTSTYFESASLR